jgi:CDP-diglyceride synthetase
MSGQFQRSRPTKKAPSINPLWRGVGCLILILLAVGGYWAAGELLKLNQRQPFLPFAIPANFSIVIIKGLPAIPGSVLVQLGTMVLVDIFAYAVMVIVYGIINPPRLGPHDAPPPERRRGRKNMSR